MRLGLLIFFLIGSRLQAQIFGEPPSDVDRRTFWGFVELGPGRAADSAVAATGIGAAMQVRQTLFVGRISSYDSQAYHSHQEVSFLVGRATRPGRFHFSAAAGLGVAGARHSRSVAIPIEVQFTQLLSSWAGIGFRGFANFNTIANSRGVTLVMQAGRLR